MSAITISRMYGSGGSEVAARVAQTLGWDLLDDALVHAVAQRLGIPPDEVEEREERVPSLVQRLGAALTLSAPEILPDQAVATLPLAEERLIEVTTHIVQEAVARGPAVLVGRGAQAILAERADVLHVFCYAPRPALAARTSQQLGIPPRDAERLVDEKNRQREQYVRTYWRRSWAAPEHYHLCLNTEWLGIDGAADLIVHLARARFGLDAVEGP